LRTSSSFTSPFDRWWRTSAWAAVEVHTRLMSAFTNTDADDRMAAPIRNTGTMMSRPWRMP
jgi:hypothetical protein